MSSGAPIPGTVIPTGALASPGGAQGLGGQNASTITSVGFTVPPIGQTVVVTVTDASWIVVGSIVYVDQAGGGIGAAGALQVTAKAGNQVTLLTPQPPPTLPLADTNQSGLLKQVSGNTTDFVDGTNKCQSLKNAVQSDVPPADATQPGLLDTLSGTATDFVGGDNNCHPMPIASASRSGDLNTLSGNATDYVDGTNNCQAFLPRVKTAPLDTLAAPTDITALNVSASAHGLMPKLPNTGKGYFRDDGTWVLPGNYYGADTTNSGAYVVTVGSDFVLEPGVVVWVTPTNSCGANPTLNVNGTGVIAIRNRANIVLSANEIVATKAFGVVYDGTIWRVITPIIRVFGTTTQAGGALSIECAGYDGVNAYVGCTGATALNLTLAHVAQGVPIQVEIYNATAMSYTVAATTETGAAAGCYWCWASAQTGATMSNLATAVTLTAGYHMILIGANRLGSILFL